MSISIAHSSEHPAACSECDAECPQDSVAGDDDLKRSAKSVEARVAASHWRRGRICLALERSKEAAAHFHTAGVVWTFLHGCSSPQAAAAQDAARITLDAPQASAVLEAIDSLEIDLFDAAESSTSGTEAELPSERSGRGIPSMPIAGLCGQGQRSWRDDASGGVNLDADEAAGVKHAPERLERSRLPDRYDLIQQDIGEDTLEHPRFFFGAEMAKDSSTEDIFLGEFEALLLEPGDLEQSLEEDRQPQEPKHPHELSAKLNLEHLLCTAELADPWPVKGSSEDRRVAQSTPKAALTQAMPDSQQRRSSAPLFISELEELASLGYDSVL